MAEQPEGCQEGARRAAVDRAEQQGGWPGWTRITPLVEPDGPLTDSPLMSVPARVNAYGDCRACLTGTCPVHKPITSPPPRQVHWAGCRGEHCESCLPPAWIQWDREIREARVARGG